MSDEYYTMPPEQRLRALCERQRRESTTKPELVKYDTLPTLLCDVEAVLSRLHQLSEDHSHCEGLLHELGERASRAESRLRTLAIGIVGARMAHVEEDYSEAYHLLYSAARALSDDPHEPWKAVDALADGAIERRDGQTFVNLPKDAERHPDDIDGDGICPINCESPEVRCGLPVGHGGPHRVVERQRPICPDIRHGLSAACPTCGGAP